MEYVANIHMLAIFRKLTLPASSGDFCLLLIFLQTV